MNPTTIELGADRTPKGTRCCVRCYAIATRDHGVDLNKTWAVLPTGQRPGLCRECLTRKERNALREAKRFENYAELLTKAASLIRLELIAAVTRAATRKGLIR